MKRILIILAFTTSILISVLNAQWIQQNSGTNAKLTDIAMLDSTTVVVVGEGSVILKTTDSGMAWTRIQLPIYLMTTWNDVSFFDTQNGIMAGDDLIATTTNGGNLWDLHPLPGGRRCLSALLVGPTDMYVGDDSGWVHNSTDTGKTWISEKISTWPIRTLFAWRSVFVMGLPIYALTPYSLCRSTEFPHGIWSEMILDPFQGLGSEAFDGEFCNGGGAGFIVGVQGDFIAAPTIVRKSMSDTAWLPVPLDFQKFGPLHGVSAPSANVIYTCGSNGMIFKSKDGGNLWTAINVPTTRNLYAIYFYDENRGFAVGDSGLILYTSNGAVTSVNNRDSFAPKEFLLNQNYPNPFNPATTISFQMPVSGQVNIEVFDMLGRKIAMLLDDYKPTGVYSLSFSGASLPSGVYFCRMTSGNFTQTKRMVLSK
jgi:photosystem II stability/assembly factor-like uncharacterized protein